MTLLTVEQAAARLKKTPRTIRRWIEKEHKINATHPTHGHTTKYLIPEEEVTRLIADIAKEQPEQVPAASEDIEKRLKHIAYVLEDLQRWFHELEQRIAALEQGVSIAPHQDGEASFSQAESHIEATRKRKPKAAIPPVQGAIEYWQFAKIHDVNRVTFRDQILKGSKRSGEQVEAIREGEKLWLTPDQQKAALEYWQRHNVPFTLPHEQEEPETDHFSKYLKETTL